MFWRDGRMEGRDGKDGRGEWKEGKDFPLSFLSFLSPRLFSS